MNSREKCRICNQRKISCCYTYPVMTEEEAARIYFEKDLPEGVTLKNTDSGFMYVPKDKVKDNKISLSDAVCPFLKDNECSIYDIRPQICRIYGEENFKCEVYDLTIEELKNMTDEELRKHIRTKQIDVAKRVLKFTMDNSASYKKVKIPKQTPFKKVMKEWKTYALLLTASYYAQLAYEEFKKDVEMMKIKAQYKYRFVLNEQGLVTAVRDSIYSSEFIEINNVCKGINFVNQRIHYTPITAVEVLVDKVNRLLKPITNNEIKGKFLGIKYFVYSVSLINNYITMFKMKPNSFKGIPLSDVISFYKKVTELTGGYEGESKFSFNKYINEAIEYAEKTYKIITKAK